MYKTWTKALLLCLIFTTTSSAAVLQVGPGKPYPTVQAAVDASVNNDTIEIHGGSIYYGLQAQVLINKDITIKGINTRPLFDCQDTGVFSIGCWVVHTNTLNVTIDNVEILNFKTPASASCIRVNTAGSFTLLNSYLHDCQQGLLTSNQTTQKFWLENNTFYRNGTPGGQTHNVYLGDSAEAVIIRNRSYNANGGQLIKTRAKINVIAFNDLGDPEAKPASNYEIDISCGGNAYIVGNKIHQQRATTNQRVITFGPETCQTGAQKLIVTGNTIYNEATGSQPVFVQVRKQANVTSFDTLTIEDNVFFGPGSIFFTPDAGLAPDVTKNVQRDIPVPPLAFVGPPTNVSHTLVATGIQLNWTLPPGATGAVIRHDGVIVPGAATQVTDTTVYPENTFVTYELRSLQGTSESSPISYTVLTPRILPSSPNPTSFSQGWYTIPNSRYQQVYPQPPVFASKHLVEAWSGAAYDPSLNRLMLFGGGGTDYAGTELLSVPFLGSPSILKAASTNLDISTLADPVEALLDGQPSWRHSYSGLAFSPSLKKLFLVGGFLPRGVPGKDLWSFDVTCACSTWQKINYTGDTVEASFGHVAVWNPTDGLLWVKTATHLYSFNPTTQVMTKRNSTNLSTGIYQSGTLDIQRQVLVLGLLSSIIEINLTGTPSITTVKTFLPEDAYLGYPGLAYDSDLQRVVLWSGGTRFGLITASGYSEINILGSPGSPTVTGTHSRFVYIPQWKVFGLQNLASQPLYIVKVN